MSSTLLLLLLLAAALTGAVATVFILRRRMPAAGPPVVHFPPHATASNTPNHRTPPLTAVSRLSISDGTHSLLDVAPWVASEAQGSQPVALPRQVAASLQSLLQLDVIKGGLTRLEEGAYVVRFSSETTARLRNGTLELMSARGGGLRAVAVTSEGNKIVEHASLQAARALPLVAAAVWQGLAVVTGQKYLADIDAKLERIETKLADLKSWLETEQLGRLEGSLAYLLHLRQALPNAIREGRAQAFEAELESVYREALSDAASLRMRMDALLDRIEATSPGRSLFNPAGVDTELPGLLAEYRRLHSAHTFALLLQGLGTEFRHVISGSTVEVEDRLASIETGLAAQQTRLVRLNRRVVKRIRRNGNARMIPISLWSKNPNKKDEPCRKLLREIGAMSQQMQSELRQSALSVRTRMAIYSHANPLELVVNTRQHGEVADVSWLQPQTAA